MDAAVLQYCSLGLVPSTNRVYKSAVNRFSAFCAKYNVTHPFPVDELLLCGFIAVLVRESLSPATSKSYLVGVPHTQIMRGLPEPKQTGSMARQKLVQAGVAWDRLNHGISLKDRRFPITARVLSALISVWATPTEASLDPTIVFDNVMLRAVATLCFLEFSNLAKSLSHPHPHLRNSVIVIGGRCSGPGVPTCSGQSPSAAIEMSPVGTRCGCVRWENWYCSVPRNRSSCICREARPEARPFLPPSQRNSLDLRCFS